MLPKKSVTDALGLPNAEEWMNMTGESTEEDTTEVELYQEDDEPEEFNLEQMQAAMAQLKAMRSHLRDLPDITSRKKQLDRLAELAERKFEDIFDRAFNCEDRFASEMINAANAMLKIALDAHSKIIDSDVKLVDLQLKKDKMEIELNLKPKSAIDDHPKDINTPSSPKTRNEVLGMGKSKNK